MHKPVIVITHERSGTHLLINIINYDKTGKFFTIGYIPPEISYNLENYKYYTQKDIYLNTYRPNSISKSHHQIQFMEEYLDFLFDKYNVIYLTREPKDVLVSYYRFLKDLSNKSKNINFPDFKDWIYMNPNEVGRKYIANYPDPHVIIEPENYPQRWKIHTNGWMKYKDNIMILRYEDILNDFKNIKDKIENYIGKKIGESIPDIKDKKLPNFVPGKGIIGEYKDYMNEDVIKWVDNINPVKIKLL